MGQSLVKWKKKVDKHDDQYADDDTDSYEVRMHDSMNEVLFINRDEVNAEAKKKLGFKSW